VSSRKWLIVIALFCIAIIVFIVYPTDEKQILSIIKKCRNAVAEENTDEIMNHLSYNYLDSYGNGYIQVRQILNSAFKKLDDIQVDNNVEKIIIDNGHAEVVLSVRVIASFGDERGYIIGDAVNAQNVTLRLDKGTHRWLITYTEGVFR
jgi:hypothetical protein